MKAKYRHFGTYAIKYKQVYCIDNIFLVVTIYEGSWHPTNPEPQVTVCYTNAEARRSFFQYCSNLEKNDHYECIYKEDT